MRKASANQAIVIGALVVAGLVLFAVLFYGPVLYRNAGSGEASSAPDPLGTVDPPGPVEGGTVGQAATRDAALSDHDALIEMTDQMRFEPATVTVLTGQTVRWVNRADVVHTVTCGRTTPEAEGHGSLPGGAEAFDSGPIQPGEAWSYTFRTPGVYEYVCTHHLASRMVATVMVEATDPQAQEGGADGADAPPP